MSYYAIFILHSATCMAHSATYCPIMQYSYCIMLHECPIRLHVIRKLDILLRYINIIFCDLFEIKLVLSICCRDASSRCAIYCVVCYIWETMQVDQQVDVFTATRKLRTQRPNFIQSMVNIYIHQLRGGAGYILESKEI